jgi:hypothetical protein
MVEPLDKTSIQAMGTSWRPYILENTARGLHAKAKICGFHIFRAHDCKSVHTDTDKVQPALFTKKAPAVARVREGERRGHILDL